MALFAVVYDNEVVDIREYDEKPACKKVDGVDVLRPFADAAETDTKKHGGYNITDDLVTRVLVDRSLDEVKTVMRQKVKLAKAQYYKVAKEKKLEDDIAAATTVAQLTALDFETGW